MIFSRPSFHWPTISGDDWRRSLQTARARPNSVVEQINAQVLWAQYTQSRGLASQAQNMAVQAAIELARSEQIRGLDATLMIDSKPFSFPQNKNLDETKSSPGLLPMNLKLHSSNTVFRNGGQQSLTFSVVDAEGKDIPGKMVQLLVPADHPILKEPNPDATYNLSLTVVS